MRKLALTILLAGSCLYALAQQPVTVPDKQYGDQGTKTTTRSTDPTTLDEITTIEYKDNLGNIRERVIWRKKLDGKYTRTREELTAGGRRTCFATFELDENKTITSVIFPINSTKNRTYIHDKDSALRSGNHLLDVSETEKIFKAEIEAIEENRPTTARETQSACRLKTGSDNCQPNTRLFFSYSYLTGLGKNSVSFPLGAQASFVFNVSPRIAIGPDISIHTRKDGDFTFTRMFFLAKGQYSFMNRDLRDTAYVPDLSSMSCPRVTPDFHVYLGYGTEKSVIRIGDNTYKNSGGGFTFGAGIGVQVKLNGSLGLGFQADYLGTKFKEADETVSDIRGSAGIFFNMGNLSHELKFGR